MSAHEAEQFLRIAHPYMSRVDHVPQSQQFPPKDNETGSTLCMISINRREGHTIHPTPPEIRHCCGRSKGTAKSEYKRKEGGYKKTCKHLIGSQCRQCLTKRYII